VLKPLGVGVVIEAYHLCMMMARREKQNSTTRGIFGQPDDLAVRQVRDVRLAENGSMWCSHIE